MVDAHGSGPCAARCGGSSPLLGTIAIIQNTQLNPLFSWVFCWPSAFGNNIRYQRVGQCFVRTAASCSIDAIKRYSTFPARSAPKAFINKSPSSATSQTQDLESGYACTDMPQLPGRRALQPHGQGDPIGACRAGHNFALHPLPRSAHVSIRRFFTEMGLAPAQPEYLVYTSPSLCPGGGIGRRAWFRSMCRKVWRFESSPGHHRYIQNTQLN